MDDNILRILSKNRGYIFYLQLRKLFVHDHIINFKRFIKNQSGGKIKKYTINDKKYYVDIEKSLIEDDKKDEYQLSFLSLNNSNTTYGIILINVNTKEAIIQDVGNLEYCVVDDENKDIKKKGFIIMNIMIDLCKKNNISNIKLADNSYHICKNVKIQLIYARTLTHGLPYYSKFGFMPINEKNVKVMKNNYKIMKKIKDFNLLKFIPKNDKYCELIKIIKKNKNKNLKNLLKYILDKNCMLFYEIHMDIYKKLKLDMYIDKMFQLKL